MDNFDRIWFALCIDKQLVCLGYLGDYEEAAKCAEDLDLEAVWFVRGYHVAQWADTINSVREEEWT